MPLPYHHVRNPFWEEGNGEPESVPYGHPNLIAASQAQPNPGSSSWAAQPRRVSSAGIPPSSGAPSFFNHMPFDDIVDLNQEDVSISGLGSPSASFPAATPAGSAPNTGTPSNAGMPDYTDPQLDLLNLQSYQTTTNTDPDLPGVVGRNGVRVDLPSWDAMLKHVRRLRSRQGMYYGGHVKNFEDHKRFKLVLKHELKRPNSGHARDMPQDEGALQQLAERLCNAMLNLDGIESALTRNQGLRNGEKRLIDSVGVKSIKEAGPLRLEMLAWDLMCAIRDAQTGNLELPGDPNEGFKEFNTFMERFTVLEEALRANKNLVKDALESNQGVNRIVADPEGERYKKNAYSTHNKTRAEHIELGRQAQKGGAAVPGTKRRGVPSTDTPTEKRTKHSAAPSIQTTLGQPQMGLQQPQLVSHHDQLPQQQGISLPASEQQQLPEQLPEQHHNAYLQPFGMQHGHVGDRSHRGQHGNPHGPPQQLGAPQHLENQPQTQVRQGWDHFQQQSGNSQQHSEQPGQQSTTIPGLVVTAALNPTTPATHDGPQPS